MCKSLMLSFLASRYIDSNVTKDGILTISYDAYSTDSSFDEVITGINFCPYCGESVKEIIEKEERDREAAEEKARKKAHEKALGIQAENEKYVRERRAKAEETLKASMEIGCWNVYEAKGHIRKATGPNNFLDLLYNEGIRDVSKSSIICLESYTKFKKQK